MDKDIAIELRNRLKRSLIRVGLEASAALDGLGLMRDAAGIGAIFTLHHVRPSSPRSFQPNRHLEITPEFLELSITRLKAAGYRFAALGELPELVAAKPAARF